MLSLQEYGIVRVAAAVPQVRVAEPDRNAGEIAALMERAAGEGVSVVVFPELSLTGYTCADLFHQSALLQGAQKALASLLTRTQGLALVAAVGLPVAADNQLFNCAALIHRGRVLGVVPKSYVPNYNEYYEKRWFSPASARVSDTVALAGQTAPFGEDLLFADEGSALVIGAEICEDLWVPSPPSALLALSGANLLVNLSASNELAGKAEYRRELVRQQSARCYAGYVYASAGPGESTTDVVYGGHSLVAESGAVLHEQRFPDGPALGVADVDLEKLGNDRRRYNSFMTRPKAAPCRSVSFRLETAPVAGLRRAVDPAPFVPCDSAERDVRCREIFKIQSTGLAQRMAKAGIARPVIGISGGLDSTLALLVAAQAVKTLGRPADDVVGVTMPGFGTTDRTRDNSLALMEELGVTVRQIPIGAACAQHFKDIGHDPAVHDVTYENVQARERTQVLMDVANQMNGLVVGTGDLSELALGWTTYNGDHMSMYGVNAGIPKTLVRYLVAWYADTQAAPRAAATLKDILATPVSPELLPPAQNGDIAQRTEDIVGDYALHDFFLYHMLRNGFPPKKIYWLATQAFEGAYAPDVILKWLRVFYRRFFSQQYKRSCLPDGVKVGSVCLSPRGDWRMPSDAAAALWLEALEEIEP